MFRSFFQFVGVLVVAGCLGGVATACPHQAGHVVIVRQVPVEVVVRAPSAEVSRPAAPSAPVAPVAPVSHVAVVSSAPASLPVVSRQEVFPSDLLRVRARQLGKEPGEVSLVIGSVRLVCEVVRWDLGSVSIRLPDVDLAEDAAAVIEVHRANGSLAKKLEVFIPVVDLHRLRESESTESLSSTNP